MYITSLLVFSISLLPNVLGGPACARRKKNAADCRTECASRWGWPGEAFGIDPWGPVLSPSSSSESAPVMPANACGLVGVNQGSSSGPVVQNPGESPSYPPDETPSDNDTSSYSYPSVPPSVASSVRSSSTPSSSSRSASHKTHSTSPQQPNETPDPITTPVQAPSLPKPSPTHRHTTTVQPPPQETNTPPSSGGGGASSSDISQFLEFHNTIRAQHGAEPLTWSDEAASKAQQWADNCQFHHSGGSLGPFGENLAAGTGDFGIKDGVQSWTNEVSDYDPNNPQPSHFTQVVWKGTTQVGCAQQSCNGIFDASFGPANYIVCEYSPAGNVIGEFAQNVQA